MVLGSWSYYRVWSPIDNIMNKCSHNKYITVSELEIHTKTLLNKGTDVKESTENRKKDCSEVNTLLQSVYEEATIARRPSGDNRDYMD